MDNIVVQIFINNQMNIILSFLTVSLPLVLANSCTFRNSTIANEFYLSINTTIDCVKVQSITCSFMFSNLTCPQAFGLILILLGNYQHEYDYK